MSPVEKNAPRVRDDLAGLVPYDPDMRAVEVMLSANENAYGLPADVRDRIARRLADVELHRYPQATAPRLRGLLAQMWGVAEKNVVVANGGDELLFNLELAYGGAGRALVNCPPTFSAYALYAELTGTRVVDVPRDGVFDVDEGALLRAATAPDAALVVLTSPNNPTGNLVDPAFVARLADATDALVLVDEAYAEFAPPEASCVPLVAEHPNVCVLRTLSKAYALAGVRLGYLIASPAVADALLAVRLPYSVSSLDQAAAETAVEMRDSFAPVVANLVENRGVLLGGLEGLAARVNELPQVAAALEAGATSRCKVFPSAGNFVLLRLPVGVEGLSEAGEVHELLAQGHSILVRDFSRTPGLAGCLRITVGTPPENDRLLAALEQILDVRTA